MKANIVQTAVLYCTALVLHHRQTTAKFTFSAGLVKTRKNPGVLFYCVASRACEVDFLTNPLHKSKPSPPLSYKLKWWNMSSTFTGLLALCVRPYMGASASEEFSALYNTRIAQYNSQFDLDNCFSISRAVLVEKNFDSGPFRALLTTWLR